MGYKEDRRTALVLLELLDSVLEGWLHALIVKKSGDAAEQPGVQLQGGP